MTAALTPSRTTAERPHLQLVPTGDDVAEPVDVVGRLVTLAAIVAVVVVALAAVALGRGAFAGAAPAPPSAEASAAATVVAQPGDSLWTIARRLHPTGDVRALVDQLVALNGTALEAGQVVQLPG